MKISIVTNVLATVVAGLALGSTAGAQQISAGPAGNRGAQFAGGAGPQTFDQGVSYAACDTCDAYGNSVNPRRGGCENCDGGFGGCESCDGGYGGFGAFGAGCGYDQCGPHYFDLSADYLYWRRDRTPRPPVVTTSLGIDGPRILSTSDIEFDSESGFRVTGRLDLGPATIVEATYFQISEWFDTARVESATGQLFSLYTDFGLDPFAGVGFDDTDNANLHQLDYESELHNAEINWRQYWVAKSPRISGTYLLGARYVRLTEELLFHTETNLGSMNNSVATENDLVGFQVGGDVAICLLQGLRVVADGKAGIYNNRSKSKNRVVATSLGPPENLLVGGNNVAFVGEASVGFVADILPSFSIRGGYQVLYLEAVTLAGDNFSTDDPFAGTRNIQLVDSGDVVFHGLYGGVEYIW